jgi:hypothetical protein
MHALKLSPTDRFNKTDAGRQEIRDRLYSLTRTARNLLLILDDTKPALEWLTLIQGASADDLQDLMNASLIEPLEEPVVAATVPLRSLVRETPAPVPATAPAAPAPRPVGQISSLNYQELYVALNSVVRDQLGLIKGFRVSLEIERAAGRAELEAVALRLVDDVQKAKGDAAARQVRRALKMPPA